MKKNVLRLTIVLLLVALCVMQFSARGDEVFTPNQPGNEPTGGDNDTETSVSALTFALNQDGQSYTVTGLKDKTKTALRTVTALVLQSTYQGASRDEHRVGCVLRLRGSDLHHHSKQRDEHRGAGVLRLHEPYEHSIQRDEGTMGNYF